MKQSRTGEGCYSETRKSAVHGSSGSAIHGLTRSRNSIPHLCGSDIDQEADRLIRKKLRHNTIQKSATDISSPNKLTITHK